MLSQNTFSDSCFFFDDWELFWIDCQLTQNSFSQGNKTTGDLFVPIGIKIVKYANYVLL